MGILWAETADQYALWDALLMSHEAGNGYLLSWYLAHQQYPRVDVDVAVFEHQGRAAAGAVLYTFRLPCGTSVCLVPSSPICQRGQEKSVFQLVKALAERAARKRAMLLQFEAFEPRMRDVIRDSLRSYRLGNEAIWKLYHPTQWRELKVELSGKTPETLLAGFGGDCRRRIRQGMGESVAVQEVAEESALDEVHSLWVRSAADRGYTPRPRDSFVSLVEEVRARQAGALLVSRINGQLAAFVFAIFHGVGSTFVATAYDAAINPGFATHLLQYRAMCMAMERGCAWYSLGGPGTAGIREYKSGFRPVLVDNWRFVTAVLHPLRVMLLKGLVGRDRTSWMERLKKWTTFRED